MSRGRLPPLRTQDPENNDDSLELPVPTSTNVNVKKKRKTVIATDDDDPAESPPMASRRRRQTLDTPVTDDSATDAVTAPPRRVRKKRKPATEGSPEQLVSDAAESNTKVNNASVKKKRKAKARLANDAPTPEYGLAAELTDLDEDIIVRSTRPTMAAAATVAVGDTALGVTTMRSEPAHKVYMEKSDGFKAADKTKLAHQRAQAADTLANAPQDDAVPTNTIEFALSTHRVFRTIALFLQGMLAGIALWQIVSTYSLLIPGLDTFTTFYAMLAIPVQCLYFFLFAIACVAALDRYDIAHMTRRLCIRSVTLQTGTICVLFYFGGLIVSLGTATLDEGIGLNQTATLTEQTISSGCPWQCSWQILNVTRGVLAILGWFVVSLRPETDRLTKSLLQANDDILQPNLFRNNTAATTATAGKQQTGVGGSTAWTTNVGHTQ